jgi:hypothetical protein
MAHATSAAHRPAVLRRGGFVADDEGGVAGEARRDAEPGARAEDGGTEAGALLDRLTEVRMNLDRERGAAPSLWLELAGLPAGERLARIAGERRFQTFGLCELLLAKAAALPPASAVPDLALDTAHLAALALEAAEHLDGAVHAPPVAHDLKARAWAEIGEARRAAGDLRGAEEALAEAAACLGHGTGDLLLDARLLEFEAAVRAAQGRPGEAEALLRQAAARYAQVNESELAARALRRREEIRSSLASPASGHPAFGSTP